MVTWQRRWRGFGLRAKILSTKVGNPTLKSDFWSKLPFAWRGPVLPFSQSCCQRRIALLNPASLNPVERIAPVHYQQLGLGVVLARAQPCDGAGPAVELPGLRHVVYAQDNACEECVLEL